MSGIDFGEINAAALAELVPHFSRSARRRGFGADALVDGRW